MVFVSKIIFRVENDLSEMLWVENYFVQSLTLFCVRNYFLSKIISLSKNYYFVENYCFVESFFCVENYFFVDNFLRRYFCRVNNLSFYFVNPLDFCHKSFFSFDFCQKIIFCQKSFAVEKSKSLYLPIGWLA